MSVNELQILRDELDIDQPTSCIFEVPAFTVPFLLGNGRAHFHHVTGRQFCVSRPPQDALDDALYS